MFTITAVCNSTAVTRSKNHIYGHSPPHRCFCSQTHPTG
nr:MAG TPA: hypothetical protein [Caudoviricetes sp.]